MRKVFNFHRLGAKKTEKLKDIVGLNQFKELALEAKQYEDYGYKLGEISGKIKRMAKDLHTETEKLENRKIPSDIKGMSKDTTNVTRRTEDLNKKIRKLNQLLENRKNIAKPDADFTKQLTDIDPEVFWNSEQQRLLLAPKEL